jgi:hypothetical protein
MRITNGEEKGYKTLCQKSFSPTFVVASDLRLELGPELRVWEVGTRLDVPFEDESGRRGAVPCTLRISEKLASCFRSGRSMAAREFNLPDYPSVYWVEGGRRGQLRIFVKEFASHRTRCRCIDLHPLTPSVKRSLPRHDLDSRWMPYAV